MKYCSIYIVTQFQTQSVKIKRKAITSNITKVVQKEQTVKIFSCFDKAFIKV